MSTAGKRIRVAAEREAARAEEPQPEGEPSDEEQETEEATPEPEPGETPGEGAEEPDAGATGTEPGEQMQGAGVPDAAEPEPGAAVALGADSTGEVEQLEKVQTRYLRAVEKVLGPVRMPPLCPACEGTGLDFTGGQGEPEFAESPDRERCPDCDGWGKVRTGSRVPTEDVLPCPTCQGAGHRVKLTVQPAPANNGEQTATGSGQSWLGDPNIAPAGANT